MEHEEGPPWTITVCPKHGRHYPARRCAICGRGIESVKVIAVGSAFEIAQRSANLQAALRRANRALCEARNCLSPGMRAGTAEAIQLLDKAADDSSAALTADST
jgi:hypothetical protein